MVLPHSLIRASQSQPVLVELKNGESYSGNLANSDNWMNLHLKDAILTAKDGDCFLRVPDVYIRGNNVKFIRVKSDIIDKLKDDILNRTQAHQRVPRFQHSKGTSNSKFHAVLKR